MRSNNKFFMGMAGLVLALTLCLPQLVLGAEADDGLDRAMQAFVSAVKSKNTSGILASFSRTTPWQLVSYNVTNQRIPSQRVTVTYSQIERDFLAKKNWYEAFFGDNNDAEVTYLTKINRTKWIKKGTAFVSAHADIWYIKWRQEAGRWVIAEIGDTVS